MKKPKIACFHYQQYHDMYVSGVSFSTDMLLKMLDDLPDQKIIFLAEADENTIRTISSIGENIGITGSVTHFSAPRFMAICSKAELCRLLDKINTNELDGLFIADVSNSHISNELDAAAYTASSMVKRGASDISLEIDFPENQMVISFAKGKYHEASIKDKICSIFKK